jgi:hypothetical protein
MSGNASYFAPVSIVVVPRVADKDVSLDAVVLQRAVCTKGRRAVANLMVDAIVHVFFMDAIVHVFF